jgi:hypothetical protein
MVVERRPIAGSLVLAGIGGIVGVALSVIPFLLISAYVRSFTATATPDSGFNVYTLGAIPCVLLGLALASAALAMLPFWATRPLGLGYLGGLVGGAAIDVLLSLTAA